MVVFSLVYMTYVACQLVAFCCVLMYRIGAEDVDGYHLPSLAYKFIRCSIRTCVFHVKQLLRNKLSIPEHLSLDIICGKRILSDMWTLKQVLLSQWTAEKVRSLALNGTSERTKILASRYECF